MNNTTDYIEDDEDFALNSHFVISRLVPHMASTTTGGSVAPPDALIAEAYPDLRVQIVSAYASNINKLLTHAIAGNCYETIRTILITAADQGTIDAVLSKVASVEEITVIINSTVKSDIGNRAIIVAIAMRYLHVVRGDTDAMKDAIKMWYWRACVEGACNVCTIFSELCQRE